ncbi:MAG: transposase [Rhodospirillales bacterium]|nr:transposase [Rhodospirillales bacterium]
MLRADGIAVNRKPVQRLMRRMGIAALGRSRRRRSQHRGTRSSRTCCGISRSTGRTRCGRRTSPTSRSAAAFCIWSP